MASARPTALPTFEVSKEGLARQLARRPKAFIVAELAQNAWDENSTRVDITMELLDGDLYKLVVEDDNPEGFSDLSHAYTLFADSLKKDDPEKRGRFNLGEKLVVAICEKVTITTTKGTVLFTDEGRFLGKKTRPAGSIFEAEIRMTEAEAAEVERFVHTLLPPADVVTTFNHVALTARSPVAEFQETLRTERADSDGNLRPTTRKTIVRVYEPADGEEAHIYELGIPVVPTGDRWHVDVGQKVPLNTDRDNVTPAFLRDVRTAVLNHTADLLSPEDAKASWVSNALEDEAVDPEAVRTAFAKRFGDKAVIHDPNDLEANKRAAAEGYTVVPGGALPKGAWKNVKAGDIALPAGKVTPSPNPNAGDQQIEFMDPSVWPGPVRTVVDFVHEYAEKLLGCPISVRVTNEVTFPFRATYGQRVMTFNLGRLGYSFFADGVTAKVIDLVIHELGHEYASDHLSQDYYRALTDLGARSTLLALEQPEFFAHHGVTELAA